MKKKRGGKKMSTVARVINFPTMRTTKKKKVDLDKSPVRFSDMSKKDQKESIESMYDED